MPVRHRNRSVTIRPKALSALKDKLKTLQVLSSENQVFYSGWALCYTNNECTHSKLLFFASLALAKFGIGVKRITQIKSARMFRNNMGINYKVVFEVMFIDNTCLEFYASFECNDFIKSAYVCEICGRSYHPILDGNYRRRSF